jgi:glycosyltransferase involved in cell wall biosynthesis
MRSTPVLARQTGMSNLHESDWHPLVSILVNNHNYGRFLAAAVDSALAQSYPNVEIIVVDDGSTDDSRAILAGYGERIQTILKSQGGQASAFNAGFLASKGEIITFLDSDDLITPDKADRLVEIFADVEIGWCFDQITYFRDDGNQEEVALSPSLKVKYGRWDERNTVSEHGYAPYIPAPTTALAFRRSLLARILPMPVESNVTLSDNYIKFLAVGLSPGFFSPLHLSLQRLHGNNAYTSSGIKRDRLRARICLKTGYYLLQKDSVMRRLAIDLSAQGLASCWFYRGIDRGYWQMARQLARQLNASELLKITRLSSKYLLKHLLTKQPKQ